MDEEGGCLLAHDGRELLLFALQRGEEEQGLLLLPVVEEQWDFGLPALR